MTEACSKIYDIFKEYFGEEHVDIQCADTARPFILVWWPEVTVTNDNDRSIDIQDLYAKIILTPEGTIPYEFSGFQLTRSTISTKQFHSGYVHSHVMPSRDRVPQFSDPCLGSGPIRHTIMELRNHFEEVTWMLFCRELALYVTVESLRGGPYIRLETVGGKEELHQYDDYNMSKRLYSFSSLDTFYCRSRNGVSIPKEKLQTILKDFAEYYLEYGHLKLRYHEEEYKVNMTCLKYIIDLSTTFIKWFNEYGNEEDRELLYNRGVLNEVIISGNKVYKPASTSVHVNSHLEGTTMFQFKDRNVCFHLFEVANEEEHKSLLLSPTISMFILANILKIINYRFKNEHNNRSERGERASSATYQRVYYV